MKVQVTQNMKQGKKLDLKRYYNILFIIIIIIEICLIINISKNLEANKSMLKTNMNTVISKKTSITQITKENEKLKKEIKNLELDRLNILTLFKNNNENLININKNISEEYNKIFEDYELKKKLFEYKIEEDNETLIELNNELKNKLFIKNKLEQELDILEETYFREIPTIKMKSSILNYNQEKINLITKWLTSLNIGQIKKYNLIFSAKEYDFDSFYFHDLCGKELSNTLILIKTENNDIIGGFTFASWEPNSLLAYDDKAFIFNLNKKQKFRISNPSSAINSRINEGPIFGIYDVIINGNKMSIQEKMESYGDNDLNIGHGVINIDNYEVFNVVFDKL